MIRRPTSPGGLLATLLAVGVLGATVLAPVLGLFVLSFRAKELPLRDGRVLRVAGTIREEPEDPARPDGPLRLRFQVPSDEHPDAEPVPYSVRADEAVSPTGRTVWSLVHYRDLLRSSRLGGLLRNSVVLCLGAGLLTLLLGIPVGWALFRTRLPGRGVAGVLLAVPLLLPTFFAAMGASTSVSVVLARLGLSGGALQLAGASVCFASLLFPIPALLVGRALASVPAGLAESARLFGGARAVRRHAVLPVVTPAVLASFGVVVVVVLSDFAVPDLLGVFLPDRAQPVHVFATEVFFQWDKNHATGRAAATGAPYVLCVLLFGLLVGRALRRCPPGILSGAWRPRPPVPLRAGASVLAGGALLVAFGLGIVLPIGAVVAWGFDPLRIPKSVAGLSELVPDSVRWLRIGLGCAALSTAAAVVLARHALRGGPLVRRGTTLAALASVVVPSMAFSAAFVLVWRGVRADPFALGKAVLVATGRFLPFAFLTVLLALREVSPGLEDAGRLLGAGPATRAWRIWGPLARRGIVGAAALVLVLALREIDAFVLVQSRILPIRIYDFVHFGRTAQVADLSLAYLAVLLVPLLVTVLCLRRPSVEDGGGPARS